MEDPTAVENFQKYLRINTMHPDPDYDEAVTFLMNYGNDLGLECQTVVVHPKKPVVLMKWVGSDPSLPSVLLNSHMDVVPVFREFWNHDPFSAHKDKDGNIFARGSQDMKCVAIQYLEAIRRMKKRGHKCKRTICLSFVPEEEVTGLLGMAKLKERDEFKALNVGFAMDEGLASPNDVYMVYNAERDPWWIWVTCKGNPGHGSKFIENTAAEKLRKMMNFLLDFREEQRAKLANDQTLCLGDVVTVNMTRLRGGVQMNVVPAELSAGFDIRIPPTVNMKEFEKKLNSWAEQAGGDIDIHFDQKSQVQKITSVDEKDQWWNAMASTFKNMEMKHKLETFTGATDSRYLRDV